MPKLDPITNKEELRWRWYLLHMAKALVPAASVTAAIKRSIREYTNEPADECREIYDDGCKCITLNPLPEAIQTEAEAVQYVGDHMWISRHLDCRWLPGDIYSTRYKLCRRHGRWWAYLYYLVIQY